MHGAVFFYFVLSDIDQELPRPHRDLESAIIEARQLPGIVIATYWASYRMIPNDTGPDGLPGNRSIYKTIAEAKEAGDLVRCDLVHDFRSTLREKDFPSKRGLKMVSVNDDIRASLGATGHTDRSPGYVSQAREESDQCVDRLIAELRELAKPVQDRVDAAVEEWEEAAGAGRVAVDTDKLRHMRRVAVSEASPRLDPRFWVVYQELLALGASEEIPPWAHDLDDHRHCDCWA